MTNAAKPRSIRSGDIHHRSVRSVRCWMWARVGEKTPDAERFAVGALIYCDPLRVASSESTHSEEHPVSRGVNQERLWPPTPSSSISRQNSASYWVSGRGIFPSGWPRGGGAKP